MKTGRYSLAELFDNDNIDRFVIPEIQRDYVWAPDNVTGLLNSIRSNYEKKISIKLQISNQGSDVDDASVMHLTKEYERLRRNTRIGFIYAYYDASDNRTLYLIDGQQRLTTLFLLLLAAYSHDGANSDQFRKRYFVNRIPRLDYSVRENSHNFLVDFIEFVLDGKGRDFVNESNCYYSGYENDPTVQSILSNYRVIKEYIKELVDQDGSAERLIDYVENFVEFNYFDTGLSSQGERLYLYMNSRGESLSDQEKIRPTIIKRCGVAKLEAGVKWETWQNFFWLHRGNNINADSGFFGFIKLAVIMHQAYRSEEFNDWKVFVTDAKTKQDVRAAFIRETYLVNQKQWIPRYILDHDDFTIAWLDRCFTAYERLSSIVEDSIGTRYPYSFVDETDWWSKETVESSSYFVICGVLYLLVRCPGATDDDVYRLGMYLYNRVNAPEISNDTAVGTLSAMKMVDSMVEQGITDVRSLALEMHLPKENHYLSIFWQHIESAEWEHLFWELTADREFNKFFGGGFDILLLLADESAQCTIEHMRNFIHRFNEKFLKVEDRYTGRRREVKEMLSYGDFSFVVSYSWKFPYVNERWKFPSNNEEWLNRILRNSDNSTRYYAIMHSYVLGKKSDNSIPWCKAMAKCLDYMNSYNFLWRYDNNDAFPNIILLKNTYATDSGSVALPALMLARKWKMGWNWAWNYAVLDFSIENGVFVECPPVCGAYALDIMFTWASDAFNWQVNLKKRGEITFSDAELKSLGTDWKQSDNDETRLILNKEFVDKTGYNNDGELESIQSILDWFEDYKPVLIDALTSSENPQV